MTLIVISSTNLGGTEVSALDLARWMDQNGARCEVVFLSTEDGPALRRAREFGLDIHTIDEAGLSRPRLVLRLARLIKSRSADEVLAFMFGSHLYVAMAARLGGARKVLAFVGNPAPDESARRGATRRRARAAQPFVSAVVACSHHVAMSIVDAYGLRPSNVEVVHNWVDVDAIEKRVESLSRRDDGIIGMIARLDRIKDHALLIRAFAVLAETHPSITLRLAGDGPERGAIEGLISELHLSQRVVMLGSIEDPATELARLTVFAFSTTRQEGFGVVLAEAMAAGVPIVATDVGPVAEVLAGTGGRVVPPGDPELLARALAEVLDDADLRRDMARKAKDLVRARYSVGKAGADIRHLLDRS